MLGLVAIILGAAFLTKIIPPETDVGVNNSHMINIDGSLVSNPLDINELNQIKSNPIFPIDAENAQVISTQALSQAHTPLLGELNPLILPLPRTPRSHSNSPVAGVQAHPI